MNNSIKFRKVISIDDKTSYLSVSRDLIHYRHKNYVGFVYIHVFFSAMLEPLHQIELPKPLEEDFFSLDMWQVQIFGDYFFTEAMQFIRNIYIH